MLALRELSHKLPGRMHFLRVSRYNARLKEISEKAQKSLITPIINALKIKKNLRNPFWESM
jgi:hypothetical protein